MSGGIPVTAVVRCARCRTKCRDASDFKGWQPSHRRNGDPRGYLCRGCAGTGISHRPKQ